MINFKKFWVVGVLLCFLFPMSSLAVPENASMTALLLPESKPLKPASVIPYVKGIYVSQRIAETTDYLQHLITESKEAGINTFVIDLGRMSKAYTQNIKLVKDNHLRYVARIVMFPGGGTPELVNSVAYWESRYQLVQDAINLGADEVQLDYIRYNTKQRQIRQNALDIYKVIKWFKTKSAGTSVSLNIAVFGETSFKPSLAIGQDIKLFSDTIDTLSPMVYPSHYFPYNLYSRQPYKTVRDSLDAVKAQFGGNPPFKLIPYIEVNNFRYKYSPEEHLNYVHAQLMAVQDAGANGWYAWSAGNKYKYLFMAAKEKDIK